MWSRPATFLACCVGWILGAGVTSAEPVYHAQGEMAGEVTATTVLLQSRLTALPGPVLNNEGDVPGAAGIARFEYSPASTFEPALQTEWQTAAPERDFIVRAQITKLQPGTVYFYRLVFGPDQQRLQVGPVRRFQTLPAADSSRPVAFCMGSCMNYHSFMVGKSNGGGPVTATEEDKRLGYRVFAAMSELQPDFFIGAGDIVYYDHPRDTAATTLPALRRKWHEQFRFPRLIEFLGHTPAFWLKDDHDFRYDDADLAGTRLPAPDLGIDLFREQMPILPAGDRESPTYRTHRVNQHLQIWLVEGRDFRSPNRMPDGPDKSIWGAEQRAWLEQTLKDSDATFKILVSPTPMVGPDRNSKVDNHANLAGFKHEADSFFAWAKAEQIGPLFLFCGDRHWQYHSIHPLGFEEFSVGALNDENAIAGVRPGGRNSTDPDGLVRQPYLYKEPTGGFLYVRQQPADDGTPQLILEHRDDHGTILNTVTKSASQTNTGR